MVPKSRLTRAKAALAETPGEENGRNSGFGSASAEDVFGSSSKFLEGQEVWKLSEGQVFTCTLSQNYASSGQRAKNFHDIQPTENGKKGALCFDRSVKSAKPQKRSLNSTCSVSKPGACNAPDL